MKSLLRKLNKRATRLYNRANPFEPCVLIVTRNTETNLFEYNGNFYSTKQELEAENNIKQKIMYLEFV